MVLERHFSVQEIAEAWGLSSQTVREIFRAEPGVLHIGKPTRRSGRAYTRRYELLRVSQSALDRVEHRLEKRPVNRLSAGDDRLKVG